LLLFRFSKRERPGVPINGLKLICGLPARPRLRSVHAPHHRQLRRIRAGCILGGTRPPLPKFRRERERLRSCFCPEGGTDKERPYVD
jgi:hypothetical protein